MKRTEVFMGPRETKGLFDCTAERGITLPNEQAQSRGISLCSGCIVAALLAWHSLCALFGDPVLNAHIVAARTFSSPLGTSLVSLHTSGCSETGHVQVRGVQ